MFNGQGETPCHGTHKAPEADRLRYERDTRTRDGGATWLTLGDRERAGMRLGVALNKANGNR